MAGESMQLVSDWRPDLTDGCRQTATGCRSVRTISRGSTLNVDTSCDYVVDIHTAVASAILAILVARVHQEMPRSRASVDDGEERRPRRPAVATTARIEWMHIPTANGSIVRPITGCPI